MPPSSEIWFMNMWTVKPFDLIFILRNKPLTGYLSSFGSTAGVGAEAARKGILRR